MTKMAKTHTVFMTKTAENPTPWDRTYLHNHLREYRLGPR